MSPALQRAVYRSLRPESTFAQSTLAQPGGGHSSQQRYARSEYRAGENPFAPLFRSSSSIPTHGSSQVPQHLPPPEDPPTKPVPSSSRRLPWQPQPVIKSEASGGLTRVHSYSGSGPARSRTPIKRETGPVKQQDSQTVFSFTTPLPERKHVEPRTVPKFRLPNFIMIHDSGSESESEGAPGGSQPVAVDSVKAEPSSQQTPPASLIYKRKHKEELLHCAHCNRTFYESSNREEPLCEYHDGELEPEDIEDRYWDTHNTDGDYPDKLEHCIWSCCGEKGNEDGCQFRQHVAIEHKRKR